MVNLILLTLKSVAYVMVEPFFIGILILVGIVFFIKNRKIVGIQNMIMGDSLDSAINLTLSQIVLGLIGGAIASIILSLLGIVFTRNSFLPVLFIFSLTTLFTKYRFTSLSYTAPILGIISIIFSYLGYEIIDVSIISLISFVGVMKIVEALLIIFDGHRGSIPIFSNKNGKIRGGYVFNRCWMLPIAFFIAYTSNFSTNDGIQLNIPSWWPILNNMYTINIIRTMTVILMPLFCVVGYKSITFTKYKREKSASSGIYSLVNGILVIACAQLGKFGLIGELLAIILCPVINETLFRIDMIREESKESLFISDEKGIVILDIVPYSVADNMGLNPGDKILGLDDENINDEKTIYSKLQSSCNNLKLKVLSKENKIKEIIYTNSENRNAGIVLVPRVVSKEKIIRF